MTYTYAVSVTILPLGLYVCPLIASVSQESPCVTQAISGMAYIKALY